MSMDTTTDGYLSFVVFGAALVVVVGQLLIRGGRDYLKDVFPDERVASSVSKLLAVLFHLFAFGTLGVISTMRVPVTGAAQTVVTKLGVVLLILGLVFGATMLALSRIRSRRQEEVFMADLHAAQATYPPPEPTPTLVQPEPITPPPAAQPEPPRAEATTSAASVPSARPTEPR